MPLAALILADSDAPGGGGSAGQALLSVAGQTLVEYQARSAKAAGALHIVVMVDALPGELVTAFDRLRDEGLSLDVARDVHEAADRVHPEEDLLVMASGVIADHGVISDLVGRAAPAVLTIPEAPAMSDFERIDGYSRWAGLALLKGAHLRQTATLLGDWSLGPTLLRWAIQHGAERVSLAEQCDVEIIADGKQAQSATKNLARTGSTDESSPFERLLAPIASIFAAAAMARPVPFDFVNLLGPALHLAALVLGWYAMPSLSFATLLLGVLAGATSARYGRAAMRNSRALLWSADTERAVLALLTLFLAMFAWRDGVGWGVISLALWMAANLSTSPQSTRWHPGAGDLGCILLVASLADMTVGGLAICIAWQLTARLAPRMHSALAAR